MPPAKVDLLCEFKGYVIMSDASVRGVVHLIEPTKTFGASGFRKRVVVLEQDLGRFTNYIPVEFVRDACDTVDELNVGDEIQVVYRLSGRKWQRDADSEVKFFVNVEGMGFKIIRPSGEDVPQGTLEDTPPPSSDHDESEFTGDDDDVPF